MKQIFLLLLAVNIGLFVWGYQREQVADHKSPRSYDVGELRLLAERKAAFESKLQQDLASVQESAQMQSAEEKVQKVMETLASGPNLRTGEDELEEKEVEQPLLAEKTKYGDEQLPQQEEDEQDSIQNAAGPDDEILASSLLGEESDQQADPGVLEEQELQAELIVEPELLTPKLICYRLGPIVEIAAVEGLSKQLMELDLNAVMHTEQVKKPKGYWVMHPALESYELAKQKLQEMKKAGLSDLWLFPKGEHKNAISLGLYSKRANAEIANKRARKKGLDTEVLVRYITFDQYWLEFQDVEGLSISEESRQSWRKTYPNEKVEFKRCSNVVTE